MISGEPRKNQTFNYKLQCLLLSHLCECFAGEFGKPQMPCKLSLLDKEFCGHFRLMPLGFTNTIQTNPFDSDLNTV